MIIEVLGTGCPKCNQLYRVAEQAASQLGLDYELVKVADIAQITARGVMMTPGLVVDGTVKVQGKVPSLEEMKQLLGG